LTIFYVRAVKQRFPILATWDCSFLWAINP